MRAAKWWVVILVAVASCGDDDGGEGMPDTGPGTADTGPARVDSGPAADTGPAPDTGVTDTWDTYARAWFETYCTECHDVPMRDYTMHARVQADAPRIRCGVADTEISGCGTGFAGPRQFPIGTGPRPSDEERRRLVAWLDSGAP